MAFVMTNGVLGTASPLAEMRKSRQLKRLAVTPLKLSELLTGFMLVQMLMSSVLAVCSSLSDGPSSGRPSRSIPMRWR
jgi:hypothetical protein